MDRSHADYIELSLQLQFNACSGAHVSKRGCQLTNGAVSRMNRHPERAPGGMRMAGSEGIREVDAWHP